MSYEYPEISAAPASNDNKRASVGAKDTSLRADEPARENPTGSAASQGDASTRPATVLVRGETIRDDRPQANDSASKDESNPEDKHNSARKKVSEAKVRMQKRLPALDDDAHVGVQMDQIVTRDGKADLSFAGCLLASAAPSSAINGEWQEYRVYETNGGKHIFSKVTRSILAEEQDAYEAEVFDPSPSSMPSQLLRSARDLTRTHPLTWSDGAVAFFGYDPLAKALYRKLGGEFDEHIS